MTSRWFSPRAFLIHLTVLGWVAGCVTAAWWQIGRASDGNAISYMYAIEWPVFAIVGVLGWWALLHVDEVTTAEREERTQFELQMRQDARAARAASRDNEDSSLAAYNDHLADLGSRPKKKLWGH